MKYRPDIQGLRAIAVLAVVMFHARLPIPGGFVGVDIFFVISGFVITGLLVREWEVHSTIRFANFYKRRFLRLTPALALVIAFAIVGSGLLMFPHEQAVTIQTGLGALALVANIVIARNTGGYFDVPAENNPLLNTWSLSVEEQFYLLFPLVLFFSWIAIRKFRLPKSTTLLVVSSIGLFSFGATLFSNTEAGKSLTWLNFYSPTVRAWEFAVGSFLFLILARTKIRSNSISTVLGLIGTVGILASLFVINDQIPFPSVWTLLPVSATALLIAVGSSGSNPFSSLLSIRPMTKLGDWSYSIYLWHWPLIVFAAFLGFESPIILASVAVFSLVPSIASYKYVENPIRDASGQFGQHFVKVVMVVLAVPLVAILIVSSLLHSKDQFPDGSEQNQLEFIASNSFPCEIAQSDGNESRCRQSKVGLPPEIAIIGDSHGEHLFPGFINQFPNRNTLYVFLPEWPYATSENSKITLSEIAESQSIETVIISSRWLDEAVEAPELDAALDSFISAGKNVVINIDTPYFSFDAQDCKFQRPFFFTRQCSEESSTLEKFFGIRQAWLQKITSQYPEVRLLDTYSNFCRGSECNMVINGELMYADRGHLNVAGSNYVVQQNADILTVFIGKN